MTAKFEKTNTNEVVLTFEISEESIITNNPIKI